MMYFCLLLVSASLWGTLGARQCPSCNLTVGIHSDWIVTTTSGGSLTVTCHHTRGDYKHAWFFHDHTSKLVIPVVGLVFRIKLSHIGYSMSNASSEDKELFSLTLSNLSVSMNNTFITCQASNNLCAVYPKQPFILVVMDETEVATTTEDVTTTTTEAVTTTTDTSCPPLPANCIVAATDQQKSCNATSLPTSILYYMGPAIAVIVTEGLIICFGLVCLCRTASSPKASSPKNSFTNPVNDCEKSTVYESSNNGHHAPSTDGPPPHAPSTDGPPSYAPQNASPSERPNVIPIAATYSPAAAPPINEPTITTALPTGAPTTTTTTAAAPPINEPTITTALPTGAPTTTTTTIYQ